MHFYNIYKHSLFYLYSKYLINIKKKFNIEYKIVKICKSNLPLWRSAHELLNVIPSRISPHKTEVP